MNTITCVGKGNQSRTFELRCEKDPFKQHWTFRAYTIPELDSGEFFEASFETDPDDETTVRSIGMHAHAPEYRQVGLPETMILHAANVIGRRIVSSRNEGERPKNERRQHPAATKVWQRLVSQRVAVYDDETDSFALLIV